MRFASIVLAFVLALDAGRQDTSSAIRLDCAGAARSSEPVILLDISAGDRVDWTRVKSELREARVCSLVPHGAWNEKTLYDVIPHLGDEQRIVLVTHASRAARIRAFAAQNPAKAAGLVAVATGPRIDVTVIYDKDRRDAAVHSGGWIRIEDGIADAVHDVLVALESKRGLPRQMTGMSARADRCVEFGSPRLRAGRNFTQPISPALQLRLLADRGRGAWVIQVTRPGREENFIWPVSPPYRTAPQMIIGTGYHVTAAMSAQMPRELRFVLTDTGYAEAVAMAETMDAGPRKFAWLRSAGRGVLTLQLTGDALDQHGDLAWIAFNGRACVPR